MLMRESNGRATADEVAPSGSHFANLPTALIGRSENKHPVAIHATVKISFMGEGRVGRPSFASRRGLEEPAKLFVGLPTGDRAKYPNFRASGMPLASPGNTVTARAD